MKGLAVCALLLCFLITVAVAEERIEVPTGKMFTLTLDSNPSTGYHWELSQSLDETKVRLDDSLYREPHTDRIGAAGVELWVFRAVGPGETTISLKSVHPWEKDATPAETASFSVIIR
jgi:predicted secreted protein